MSESVAIIRGTNNKPVSSEALIQVLTQQEDLSGLLFIGYPIIGTSDGRFPIDALLVSPNKGVVVFDLIEGNNPAEFNQRQDDLANKLEARLKMHRELLRRRNLLIPIHTVSFGPALKEAVTNIVPDYPITNQGNLLNALSGITWPETDANTYESALSVLQSISMIRKGRAKRTISSLDSRGAKLKRLEDSIATLDTMQSKAVIETAEGVQRIRGLAGSGKTIVLALKAAYLHAQHPEWRIAVTFNTRSLKGQFRQLITDFSLDQGGEEPDWENLRILNAWGAPGARERDGIYHEFCMAHDVEYHDFRFAKAHFGQTDAFAGACESALEKMRDKKAIYDAILVDEAQDFPPTFLRLCYEFLDDHKRLVYAYDELQNLAGESLPSAEELFGRQNDSSPRVSFIVESPNEPRRDIILEKCYRNSRPVLVTAHSLGFGIYREPSKTGGVGMVQMFDHPQLWEEIGYRRKDGELRDGAQVTLYRPEDTSPKFLEEHSAIDDLVLFRCFENEEAQAEWLSQAIKFNLEKEELRCDDIVVINPDPLTTREKVGPARLRLLELGISSHLAGVDTNPDVFFQQDAASITFTGIFRAKGNEAGMVYIINAQDCHSATWNLARTRNRLFTAITRSKAWVRVLGVGSGMDRLVSEYERLKEQHYELHFTYPTKKQREQLRIVHRDMTADEQRRLKSREKGLLDLIADLESGSVYPEDLDDELIAKLKELLIKKG